MGCSRSSFTIPARDGPLVVEIRYPLPGAAVAADSVATWGTVGTGRATLRVNGQPVRVEANGTFATFLGFPKGDRPVLRFVASKGRDSVVREVPLLHGGDGTATTPDTVIRPWSRWVAMRRLPSDTADSATQWRPIYSRWRPRGGVALALPQGMRLRADARTESAVRLRISDDLRLLSSGPETGLGELELPAVQPGSSIMPGKVNPSLLECLDMVCFQIVGRDTAVSLAAQAGQLDLDVMTPLTAYDLLDSLRMLTGYLPVVGARCIRGIRADEARCRDHAKAGRSMAGLLDPRLGHAKAAEMFKNAQRPRR